MIIKTVNRQSLLGKRSRLSPFCHTILLFRNHSTCQQSLILIDYPFQMNPNIQVFERRLPLSTENVLSYSKENTDDNRIDYYYPYVIYIDPNTISFVDSEFSSTSVTLLRPPDKK